MERNEEQENEQSQRTHQKLESRSKIENIPDNDTVYDGIFSYGFSQLRALEFFVFRKMEMPETQNPPAMRVESICL